MRYAIAIDLLKCMGCGACAVKCRAARGTPNDIAYLKISLLQIGTYPQVRMKFLPIACMQCRKPACLEVCPTAATYQRDDGIVMIDPAKCVGCGACVVACPYGSRQIIKAIQPYYQDQVATPFEARTQKQHAKGLSVKCDFCLPRLEKGLLPACVTTCPAQARIFGDLDDPNSELSMLINRSETRQLRPEYGTDPCIYYFRD
jgi:molybdopterin-containing oxidoreductase family iron-sulfur binding subunit